MLGFYDMEKVQIMLPVVGETDGSGQWALSNGDVMMVNSSELPSPGNL